jgi:hypothetical protein
VVFQVWDRATPDSLVEIQNRARLRIKCGPFGKFRPVGVAVCGKIHPVLRNSASELAVRIGPSPFTGHEIAERISKLCTVVGTKILAEILDEALLGRRRLSRRRAGDAAVLSNHCQIRHPVPADAAGSAREHGERLGRRARQYPDRTVPRRGRSGPERRYVVARKADFSADFAYTVAKSLDEHRDLFRWTHVPFTYDSRLVTQLPPVPLHSGAERCYREVSYLK